MLSMINQVEDSSLKQQFLVRLQNLRNQRSGHKLSAYKFIKTNCHNNLQSDKNPRQINHSISRHYLQIMIPNLRDISGMFISTSGTQTSHTQSPSEHQNQTQDYSLFLNPINRSYIIITIKNKAISRINLLAITNSQTLIPTSYPRKIKESFMAAQTNQFNFSNKYPLVHMSNNAIHFFTPTAFTLRHPFHSFSIKTINIASMQTNVLTLTYAISHHNSSFHIFVYCLPHCPSRSEY